MKPLAENSEAFGSFEEEWEKLCKKLYQFLLQCNFLSGLKLEKTLGVPGVKEEEEKRASMFDDIVKHILDLVSQELVERSEILDKIHSYFQEVASKTSEASAWKYKVDSEKLVGEIEKALDEAEKANIEVVEVSGVVSRVRGVLDE